MAEKQGAKLKKTDKKKLVITGFALFVIAMLVSVIGMADTAGWSGDFSQYIGQARAIADGNVAGWFARHSYTIDHSMSGLGAHSYPWLTSILIAPIYAVWGINFIPYQIFMAFCFAVSVVALYVLLVRRNVKYSAILLICGAVTINAHYILLTKSVLSDIPCLMFTIITWVFIDLYLESRSIKYAVLTGVFAFAAFSTRTMALALLAALGIIDLIHFIKKIKDKELTLKHFAVMCVPYVSFLVLAVIISVVLPKGGSTYLDYFALEAKQLASNISYYGNMSLSLFTQDIQRMSFMPKAVRDHTKVFLLCYFILMLPSVAALIQGIIKRIKMKDHLPLYLIVMLAMLFVYDYQQGTRFIISLFPVILLCMYYGIDNAKEKIEELLQKNRKMADKKSSLRDKLLKTCIYDFVLVLVLCMVFGVIKVANGYTGSPEKGEGSNSDDAMAVYAYINENLDSDDVVVFFRPRILCLYTQVNSYTNSTDIPETIGDADYLLNYCGDSRYQDYINSHRDSLKVEYTNSQFRLYKIVKEK